jgi:Phage conserved hypothetical protein BR0599
MTDTFYSLETSVDSGKPRALILFQYRDNYYSYAFGKESVTFATLSGTDISCDSTSIISVTTEFTSDLPCLIPDMWMRIAGFSDSTNNSEFKIVSVAKHKVVLDATLIPESAGNTILINSFTYTGVAGMSMDAIKASAKTETSPGIRVPRDNPVAALYQNKPPSTDVWCSLFAYHSGLDSYVRNYSGYVGLAGWEGSFAKLSISLPIMAIKREGLSYKCGVECNHKCGGSECGVDLDSYAVSGTVSSISGKTIVMQTGTLSSKANGYYDPGLCFTPGGKTSVYDMLDPILITSHVGDTITLLKLPENISVSDTLYITPVCNNYKTLCKDIYDNMINYGGYLHLPDYDPHKTGMIQTFYKGQ